MLQDQSRKKNEKKQKISIYRFNMHNIYNKTQMLHLNLLLPLLLELDNETQSSRCFRILTHCVILLGDTS